MGGAENLVASGVRRRYAAGRRRSLLQVEGLERRELLAANLTAHWLASDLTGAQGDGSAVAAWSDRVGQLEAGGTGTPRFAEGVFDGHPAVRFSRFDGVDTFTLAAADNPIGGAEDFSVLVVFATETNDLNGGEAAWFLNTGLVDATDFFGTTSDWGVVLSRDGRVGAGLGGPPTSLYSNQSGLNDGLVHVAVYTRQAGTLSVYVDSQLEGARSDGGTGPRIATPLTIGAINGGQFGFSGDLAEVRTYDGALTADEVVSVSVELLRKYTYVAPLGHDDQYGTDEDLPLVVDVSAGLLANDVNYEPEAMTAVLEAAPQHGQIELAADGSFVYTPAVNFFGADSFTYLARTLADSRPVQVNIDIASVFDQASAVDDAYLVEASRVFVAPTGEGLLANDLNLDREPLTARLVEDVAAGQLTLLDDGSFTYDPQGFSGVASFRYQVSDSRGARNTATVTLLVDHAPVAADDSYSTEEERTLTLDAAQGILTNDSDANADQLTPIVTVPPQHGKLTLDLDGSFVYRPDNDFFGQDQFTYLLDDGDQRSAAAVVRFEIAAINDPPAALPRRFVVAAGGTLSVAAADGLLADASDPDGDALTAERVSNASFGLVDVQEDGAFVYRPAAGFVGHDRFQYRVGDGTAFSQDAAVELFVHPRAVVIAEFAASNASGLSTRTRQAATAKFWGEQKAYDWIELENRSDVAFDLSGASLSDAAGDPRRWQFPAGTVLPPRGSLVLFASGLDIVDPALDEQGLFHTNFQLSGDGEALLLLGPDGEVWFDWGPSYPAQPVDVSQGLVGDQVRWLTEPTPGLPNTGGALRFAAEPSVSEASGFYTAALQVVVQPATPGATLRYTLDGSEPTATHGQDYLQPLTIDRTTVLRVRAVRPDWVASSVASRSYLFLEDIVRQDRDAALAAGLPERWGSTAPDYGLDDAAQLPAIAGDPTLTLSEARQRIADSLTSIPTLSLAINAEDMFGSTRGIYTLAGQAGEAWERATTAEWIDPQGGDGFRIDAGIRIQGGAFRGFGLTRKKSLRLVFNDEYGAGKLRFPVFGADAAQEFDTLTLRMEANDGWQWGAAGNQPQYARDEFGRRIQLAMGQPASHGTHAHVYINGQYWGLYNVVERPDAGFAASYLDVARDDWDGINSGNPPGAGSAINDGGNLERAVRTVEAWNELMRLAREVPAAANEAERTAALYRVQGRAGADGSDDPALASYLDVENMIDYLIVNYYVGNTDWPQKNYYVGRENSLDSEGFRFFMWDAEWSLLLRNNINTDQSNNGSGVAAPFQLLRESEEFRVQFGDRVQRHLFNGGPLYVDPEQPTWDPAQPERNMPAATYVAITEAVYPALIAESARWGDQHRVEPYTRDVDWQSERDRLLSDWFPQRSGILLDQFRSGGLYPTVAAPVFSQRGGSMQGDATIELTAAEGAIYYTTDGSDPRSVGGGIGPSARRYQGRLTLLADSTLKVRALHEGQWSALDEAEFQLPRVAADASNLRVGELHYHPGAATAAEVLVGFTDGDDFEFLELVNLSDQTVDLSDVQLVQADVAGQLQGVAFSFTPSYSSLAPGERVVVVENSGAFRVRYGDNLPVAGEWTGGLSNNSERILLQAAGATIQEFDYDDDWHPQTDGDGPSLLSTDVAHADLTRWSSAAGWQPSPAPAGTPGRGSLRGDFDLNETVNVADVDRLLARVRAFARQSAYDLTGDGRVDREDIRELVEGTLQTRVGDANLDGDVDVQQADGRGDGEVLLASLGKDPLQGWTDGDFDGDGWVTASGDGALLLAALAADTAAEAGVINAAFASWQVPDLPAVRRESTWDGTK